MMRYTLTDDARSFAFTPSPFTLRGSDLVAVQPAFGRHKPTTAISCAFAARSLAARHACVIHQCVFGGERVAMSTLIDFRLGLATALRGHVPKVVVLRAEEEVCWPHACWIVAMVKNSELASDRTVRENITHAMCAKRSADVAARRDDTVSVTVGLGRPQPALATSINLRPESANERIGDDDRKGSHARHDINLILGGERGIH